jgi:hypothetical protein
MNIASVRAAPDVANTIRKNAERLYVACALINIFQLRRPLMRLAQGTCR